MNAIHPSEATPMKIDRFATKVRRATLAATFAAGLAAPLGAQAFDSGSDGSYGPIDVAAGTTTINLPPDGVIHATTVNVQAGGVLKFNRNALNTPVYLLATGDVTITGVIDVNGTGGSGTANGLGGPGGFDGGAPASGGNGPGHGLGPGGGGPGDDTFTATGAGAAAYGGLPTTSTDAVGSVYGNAMLIPLIGGSGGGGATNSGGGGGGGAILVASNTRIAIAHGGTVRAVGGGDVNAGARNEGSGGAIRLVAPVVASISGGVAFLDASGGPEDFNGAVRGGHGRIRIDALDTRTLVADYVPDNAASVGSILVVKPTLPKLSLANVAGTAIAEDTTANAAIFLPAGSSTTQSVTVRARDFGTVVPFKVVVTPANGTRTVVSDTVDNTSANPATKAVNITVPVDMPVDVAVWTGT